MPLVDLDEIPLIQARWYRQGRRSPISIAVVHTPEFPELNDGAERLANYFAITDRQASVHCTVDSDSIIRSVQDTDTAFGAENANSNGLHAELVGYAGQTVEEWTDEYSLAVVDRAAGLFAAWCLRYDLPPVLLDEWDVQQGYKGIAGHGTIYRALGGTAVRSDPGDNFPWGLFIGLTDQYYTNDLLKKVRTEMYIGYTQGADGIVTGAHLIENGMATVEFPTEPRGMYTMPQRAIDFRLNSGGTIPFLKISPEKVREFRAHYYHVKGNREFVAI